MVPLPADVTVPPPRAEVEVTEDISLVVTVGTVTLFSVVNDFCAPYAVPALFVAYALT